MQGKILIADDEKNMRWALEKALTKAKYEVYSVSDGKEVLDNLDWNPDLILMDLRMPVLDGMETLRRLKDINDKIPVIMITAHGSIESAIEAMRLGAIDYVTKPFDIEEVKVLIEKALKFGSMAEEILFLRNELYHQEETEGIIGQSPVIAKIIQTVRQVAASNATILILGESGTGKELVANAIHSLSNRKNGPYIKINCGALPENLLESELFGHEKGAFTGAVARKPGRFERAKGGTIFLDEVAEISLATQVKLLRVLQEKEFERVGGTEVIDADARIIAATNRNLAEMISEGTFREDLYYRLNVIPIHLPSLRERTDDIPLLADYFIRKYNKENGKIISGIDKQAMELMLQYPWPGNIRELENVIERAVILCKESYIKAQLLPKEILLYIKSGQYALYTLPAEGISLDEVEKSFILQALERSDGNQTQAAKLLGITRHTLLYRMEKYNISK